MKAMRRIFSILLVVTTLLLGTAFSDRVEHQALAKALTPEAEQYNFDGGSSVDAYRNLQKRTYAYRNSGFGGEGDQTGRLGNRLELTQRTGSKLQQRMDSRRDLTSQPNSVDQAAKNMVDNTQNAFQRAGKKIQRGFDLD